MLCSAICVWRALWLARAWQYSDYRIRTPPLTIPIDPVHPLTRAGGILPLIMPFSRHELRGHEYIRPERRALVALGPSTVKHNSYRSSAGVASTVPRPAGEHLYLGEIRLS